MINNQEKIKGSTIKAKILLLGDGGVGKTSLRKWFSQGTFSESYLMTIGASFSKKEIILENNIRVETQIWDLAGQDSFSHVTSRFMMGAHGALVIFDLTRKDSLMTIGKWLDRMYQFNKDRVIPFLIVGNKADLAKGKASINEIDTYLRYFRKHHSKSNACVKFIITSAKTGQNVNEAFTDLGQAIVSQTVIS